ncbi:16522_t:CDS:2, partial [Cetraspora pellucida]
MSIEQVWNEYKQQRDGDFFTDNASVVFVPTAAGARGNEATRNFLSAAYDTRLLSVKENVLYQTIGQATIVEESETTVNFVSGEGAWLVPGIDSRYTVDNHVLFPTVTVATFEGGKISSIRVYWDQATVLKQLKLIGDKNTWPVLGERQLDAVKDTSNAILNPFGRVEPIAARMNPNQTSSGRRNVHTSSRVNQPGGTGGKSTIFNSEPDD